MKFQGVEISGHSRPWISFSTCLPFSFPEYWASNMLHSTLRFFLESKRNAKEVGGYIFLHACLFIAGLKALASLFLYIMYFFSLLN